ncbi:MAG: YidH family protein [Heliomarina sp.]|uniref:YidH family protein n=1 Tax=Heliomarina sp. TaxID=2917556 RepID=UPI0040590793
MIFNFELHASNERTFLSWVRTAVAIVGFGLAAARLGQRTVPHWSTWLLFGAGAAVVMIAWLRMRHVRKRIDLEERLPDDDGSAATFLLLLVMALFVLLGSFAVHVAP